MGARMISIHKGDCREVLRTLPDESVHCVVTSPPYWGLRDYGIPASVWGGDLECEHEWGEHIAVNATNHTTKARWNHTRNGRDELQPIEKRVSWLRTEVKQGQFCQHCGAWAGALGLEPSYQLYVEYAVEVFREVRRVLRLDGTLWLNLGDTYNNADKWGGGGVNTGKHTKSPDGSVPSWAAVRRRWSSSGLKPKDLCGIPWRVAFALQEDGWYLRQDIIWSKPNPMPESVTDRCTKAHEYLFLLSKSERYCFDQAAISEPCAESTIAAHAGRSPTGIGPRSLDTSPPGHPTQLHPDKHHNGRGLGNGESRDLSSRNKRSVWEVATQPLSEAHFATFPPALIKPCILAGCPHEGIVLDPFAGAGTTGLVADRLGRNAILIELNPEYVAMIDRRISADAGMFADIRSEAGATPAASSIPSRRSASRRCSTE
jgi:DNA modification methylase